MTLKMICRMKPFRTKYWRPGDDHLRIIVDTLRDEVRDGDIVIISEKAIATAKGILVDESKVVPSSFAKFLARCWMRYGWGYILSPLCHHKQRTVHRLRSYPLPEGAHHKQVALSYAGVLHAMRHGSEGGIDVSNIPYSYACLPLSDAYHEAVKIADHISSSTGKEVGVMIVDTDMTYSFRGLNITPRPRPMKGIVSIGGFITYVLCRVFKLPPKATPLAVSDSTISVQEALMLAEMAHHVRGSGAGKTVWDVSERFGVGLTKVTWEMLDNVPHYPIVLARPYRAPWALPI